MSGSSSTLSSPVHSAVYNPRSRSPNLAKSPPMSNHHRSEAVGRGKGGGKDNGVGSQQNRRRRSLHTANDDRMGKKQ